MAKETVEDRLARLEALMDQVISSPRVRPYVLGQIEQRFAPADFVTPSNDVKEKFPPTKEELAAEEEVARCRAEVERLRFAQIEAQKIAPGRYITENPDGTKYVNEVGPEEAAQANLAFSIEVTPELDAAEKLLVKAKIRRIKLGRERDEKARAWTAQQSGMKPAPAEKVAIRRRF